MQNFEQLGVFYLGREYDLARKKAREGLLLYESRDLVTHAVCVGMTGSGKTGLCLALLEEAAMDGVPVIAIDPKGDLGNLLLTFPELNGESFEPWVNEDDARRAGLSVSAFAAQQATTWEKGLAGWGQDAERIARLRQTADFAIFTPGSSAGIPLSVLSSFDAPSDAIREDQELFRERISTTVSSLLGLLGIEADPIRSREHILLSNILQARWGNGEALDLAALIAAIQKPPFARIGVMDLETFYPSKDRFELAMQLNNLLASPGFSAWLEGIPMDIKGLLYTPDGRPRVAIISIAHLGDAERMFVVALLLNQLLSWMRQQSGTSSLRAMLYMDEIFGYFPPVKNPPSKQPLLTLLKQARAFGLGVTLATQNPVDLDYKGLANIGTWFIGRLQTARDKERVLEGLEGAATHSGASFDRAAMEATLSALGNRIFLLHNVHEDGPVVFETRWAMSYLRGPLARAQIKQLMDPRRAEFSASKPGRSRGSSSRPAAQVGREVDAVEPASPSASNSSSLSGAPPTVADLEQYFLPPKRAGSRRGGSALTYRPLVFGAAELHFRDAKARIETVQEVHLLAPITDNPVPVRWEDALETQLTPDHLEKEPPSGAGFAELPSVATRKKALDGWEKELATFLTRYRSLDLLRSPSTGLVSNVDESERDFRARLQLAAREGRDEKIDALKQKFAPKVAALEEKLRRAEQQVAKEQAEAQASQVSSFFSVGATVLGSLFGRKAVTASTIRKASSAAKGVSRTMKESGDVSRAEANVQALQEQLAELEAECEAEVAALKASSDPAREELETLSLRPKKADVSIRLVALAWGPYLGEEADAAPAWE